ncbi:MAG: 4Fe-4S dicluster domain-containing protein [Actinomycetota bacterium]
MNEVEVYQGVSRAHTEVARHYSSPFLMGPPVCDELMALVEHMYTEEQADVVRHLKPWRPRTLRSLARVSGRSVEEAGEVMKEIAHEKYLVLAYGKDWGPRELFLLLPIVPGTFESALIRASADSVTPWHRRFAELFEELFETGFTTDYVKARPLDAVRYLPVGESISDDSRALPSDRLGEMLERYDKFAVGVCQCRLTKQLVGDGCGRALETCTTIGRLAPYLVEQGRAKSASLADVLEIKAAAEKEGSVTWMMNFDGGALGNASCSCCGCCCGALRTVSEFNTPGFVAPPRYVPRIGADCTTCLKCVKACPMKALEGVEGSKTAPRHLRERCIGCGLCAVSCGPGSITMEAVPEVAGPRRFAFELPRSIARDLSNMLKVRALRRSAD